MHTQLERREGKPIFRASVEQDRSTRDQGEAMSQQKATTIAIPIPMIGRHSDSAWSRKRRRTFVAFLAPAIIVLFTVTILPFVYLVATSFTPLNPTKPHSFRWIGLNNYQSLLADQRFWNSIWVQARLSFWTVFLQMLLGLCFAVLLNTRIKFREAVRISVLIPMVLPPVVVALIWKVLFTPNISILNWALGLVGVSQPAWLTDPKLALWAIIIADVWEWFPFVLLLLLAALQMVPDEPMEAAKIDGASNVQVFWHVTLPFLRPALLLAGLFRLIDSFKAFPQIFILTGGGPGIVTEPTNYYAYLEGFSYTFIGYSSAIIVIMLIVVFALSFFISKAVSRGVDIE